MPTYSSAPKTSLPPHANPRDRKCEHLRLTTLQAGEDIRHIRRKIEGGCCGHCRRCRNLADPKGIHDGAGERHRQRISAHHDACFATSLSSLLKLSSLRSLRSRSRSTRINRRVRRKGTSQVKSVDDLEDGTSSSAFPRSLRHDR